MPQFQFKQQPQYPIRVIDTDTPITGEQLEGAFAGSDSITLCVRTASGHENRGGHFFCIRRERPTGRLHLETMEGDAVDTFTPQRMLRFLNHAAGLRFDGELLAYCQNSVNFRSD